MAIVHALRCIKYVWIYTASMDKCKIVQAMISVQRLNGTFCSLRGPSSARPSRGIQQVHLGMDCNNKSLKRAKKHMKRCCFKSNVSNSDHSHLTSVVFSCISDCLFMDC